MGQIAAIICQIYKLNAKGFANNTHVSPTNAQGIDLKILKVFFQRNNLHCQESSNYYYKTGRSFLSSFR